MAVMHFYELGKESKAKKFPKTIKALSDTYILTARLFDNSYHH